jgi:hypothetical protein
VWALSQRAFGFCGVWVGVLVGSEGVLGYVVFVPFFLGFS